MRKLEFCRKFLDPGGECNFEIVYYITVDEILSNGDIVMENYGVGIVLENGEEDIVRGITANAAKIEHILNLLANGTVTPICLRDILCDVLEVIE
jgi:hypothetical protein